MYSFNCERLDCEQYGITRPATNHVIANSVYFWDEISVNTKFHPQN